MRPNSRGARQAPANPFYWSPPPAEKPAPSAKPAPPPSAAYSPPPPKEPSRRKPQPSISPPQASSPPAVPPEPRRKTAADFTWQAPAPVIYDFKFQGGYYSAKLSPTATDEAILQKAREVTKNSSIVVAEANRPERKFKFVSPEYAPKPVGPEVEMKFRIRGKLYPVNTLRTTTEEAEILRVARTFSGISTLEIQNIDRTCWVVAFRG
jgi:hypothetical protein